MGDLVFLKTGHETADLVSDFAIEEEPGWEWKGKYVEHIPES